MESASENPTRPGRGRPASMTPEQVALLASVYPEITTRRQAQDALSNASDAVAESQWSEDPEGQAPRLPVSVGPRPLDLLQRRGGMEL